MGRLFRQLRWLLSHPPTTPTSCKMENAQGGRKHLPKSKQPFYKRNNCTIFELEASLQSLENELITAVTAKIDDEEMKQLFLGAPQLHHFCPYGERNSDMMTLSHINISSEESLNGGGQVWLSGTVPHQEPDTDSLSLPSSLHTEILRGRHASFSHTNSRTQVIRLYLLS